MLLVGAISLFLARNTKCSVHTKLVTSRWTKINWQSLTLLFNIASTVTGTWHALNPTIHFTRTDGKAQRYPHCSILGSCYLEGRGHMFLRLSHSFHADTLAPNRPAVNWWWMSVWNTSTLPFPPTWSVLPISNKCRYSYYFSCYCVKYNKDMSFS